MKISYTLFARKTEEEEPWLTRCVLQPAKNFVPDWFKSMKERGTLKMCPSFRSTFSNGYVFTLPQDILVERLNDGIRIEGHATGLDLFSTHPEIQFGDDYPFENGFTRSSCKFHSHYALSASKPFDVIIQPCWWHESYNAIRAQHGMFRCSGKDSIVEYNINTFIKVPENVGDTYVVPAGTPIAQLFFCHVIDAELRKSSFLEKRRAKESMIYKRLVNTATFSKEYFKWLNRFMIKREK